MVTIIGGDAEIFYHSGHPCRLLVADTDDLDVGMVEGVAQQVAHVEVVKVDSGNANFHKSGFAQFKSESCKRKSRGSIAIKRPGSKLI